MENIIQIIIGLLINTAYFLFIWKFLKKVTLRELIIICLFLILISAALSVVGFTFPINYLTGTVFVILLFVTLIKLL